MNVKAIILQTPKINTIKNDEMEKMMQDTCMHINYELLSYLEVNPLDMISGD